MVWPDFYNAYNDIVPQKISCTEENFKSNIKGGKVSKITIMFLWSFYMTLPLKFIRNDFICPHPSAAEEFENIMFKFEQLLDLESCHCSK